MTIENRSAARRASPTTVGVPRHAPLGWFSSEHRYDVPGTYVHEANSRACLGLVLHAEGRLTSIVGGRETRHELRDGMVGIVPPDHARHTVVVETGAATAAFILLVPPSTLSRIADTEGVGGGGGVRGEMAFTHRSLFSLLDRVRRLSAGGAPMALAADEATGMLLLEAIRLTTGAVPDWVGDRGVFDAVTMADIGAAIDGTLSGRSRLEDLAALTGLSPGHFARKFRRSTGLSVERFINHRRVAAAFRHLAGDDIPLSQLAVRLGFASHSHFTRVFSAWTGMTPAAYRHGLRRGQSAGQRVFPRLAAQVTGRFRNVTPDREE